MPKTSSSTHQPSKLDANMHIENYENNHIDETNDVEEAQAMNPIISSSLQDDSSSLKEKAMGKVRSILQQVLNPKNMDSANKKITENRPAINNENETEPLQYSKENQAAHYLSKLIQITSTHPEYLKTEGVLRLLTNHVEKQTTLENMDEFFTKAQTSICSVNLLTVLIKEQLKNALSQEQKESIILALGVTANEFNKQCIAELRFHEINQELENHIPDVKSLPVPLLETIYFSRQLVTSQSINKMPPSAVAFSLAPCLLPELKRSSEFLLTLLRFEIQLNTLLKLAFKKWIIG